MFNFGLQNYDLVSDFPNLFEKNRMLVISRLLSSLKVTAFCLIHINRSKNMAYPSLRPCSYWVQMSSGTPAYRQLEGRHA